MPVMVYVPARLGEGYFSDLPAPVSGDDGKFIKYQHSTTSFVYATVGAVPGGSTTQVQYNNAGVFAGDAGMTYDAANDRLTVAGGLVAPSIRPASDSTTALQLQNAAGTAVVTVDSTNRNVTIINSALSVSGGTGTKILSLKNGSGSLDFYRASQAATGLDLWTIRMIVDPALSAIPIDFGLNYNYGSPGLYLNNMGVHFANIDTLFKQDANYMRIHMRPSKIFELWEYTGVGMGMQYRPDSYWKLFNNYGSNNILYANATSGFVSIGHSAATALLDLAASTTARASLRIRSGVAPTTPNDGDIWFDGTDFKCRIGGVTKTFTVT